MRDMHRQRGVTLIELVVVMIIVAILAAVAIPSYRSYVLRSQRSDAKDALLALATAQEKHYLQCNNYAADIAPAPDCVAGELQGADASKNGWYDLDITSNVNATTYTVTATAVNGGNQWQDTECRTFIVTDGIRTATDAGNADNTAECWR